MTRAAALLPAGFRHSVALASVPAETSHVILAVIALAAVLAALAAVYQKRKLYGQADKMLDQILEHEKIGLSDIQEGALSALASKAIRVQEKIDCEIDRAQEEKEQVKSLISNMSHQLKTPLGNVMMYRDLLETDISPQQRMLFLDKMKKQLDKTDWILQSLFKMAKLEQGAIQFETEAASIRETLLGAVNTVYARAEKKQIEILAEPFADVMLMQNRKWTAEVFCNILENAIKYSGENSRIQISVHPLELFTEIRISDCGMGIRQEELPHIFKRFYRCSEAENIEGSGIGLYLARLILEKEKGYLTVTSEYGKGSSFHVFLQNCQF